MKKVQGVPLPLGVTLYEKETNFSVVVEKHRTCQLLLYKVGESQPSITIDMPSEAGIGEVRFVGIQGIHPLDWEYHYKIDQQIVIDPYAKALVGRECWGENKDDAPQEVRGKVGISSFDWSQDKVLRIPDNEVIAYNIHIRGFTKSKTSRVKHKGTFRGVIEQIPYLQSLGVNQIQCMPIYEFNECGQKINYWGYGEGFYFAPKSAFAASKDAIAECKELVLACHQSNIEVVFELPFCQKESMQYMQDCIQYYVMEYHIDGVILNPEVVSISMIKNNPLMRDTKILTYNDNFQTVMRRFLRGEEGMVTEVMWNARTLSYKEGQYNYITNHNGFTLADLVAYDGKHNEKNGERNQDGSDYNYSWNCGEEGTTRKKAIATLRKKQMKNAFALLLLSQGTPCILAGDEFANSQEGNNNVYCQDNEVGWLNWNQLEKEGWLFQYVKDMILFRKRHPILHWKEPLLGIDTMRCGIPDISYHGEDAWQVPAEVASRQLGIMYCGVCAKDEDCFVAYNLHWIKHSFALPSLGEEKTWYLVADTTNGVSQHPTAVIEQKKVTLEERTIAIYLGR